MIQNLAPTKKMKLIEGAYKPSEVLNVLSTLVNENINFYKLQSLKEWECDNGYDCNDFDQKIASLMNERENLRALINQAKTSGHELSITSTINIELVKANKKEVKYAS